MTHSNKLFNFILYKLTYVYLTIGLILIDLLTKKYIQNNFSYNEPKIFIKNLLNIRFVYNKGAAFSILSGMNIILLIPALIFIFVGTYILIKRKQSKFFLSSISLILAGAFGNAYDRYFLGHVRDFFELDFINFAIFNVADIFITIGSIFLLIHILKNNEATN